MEQWRLELGLRMLEPEAPQYALLEVAAPLQEAQLLVSPRLAPEVGGEKSKAYSATSQL